MNENMTNVADYTHNLWSGLPTTFEIKGIRFYRLVIGYACRTKKASVEHRQL